MQNSNHVGGMGERRQYNWLPELPADTIGAETDPCFNKQKVRNPA